MRELFGSETEFRWRPHFFPFTEPSFELDVRVELNGSRRWLEMAGCGMVDPAVFQAVNARRGDLAYDPEQVTGFAFGFGLDRLAMNMAAVPDIRAFIESDQRFLAQASAVLASGMDYELTLARIAELAVPDLADWCTVSVPAGDRLRTVAVVCPLCACEVLR